MKKKEEHINNLIKMVNSQVIGQVKLIINVKHFVPNNVLGNVKNGDVLYVISPMNTDRLVDTKKQIVELFVRKDHLVLHSVGLGNAPIVFLQYQLI